jgi:hypothetical protein
MSSERMAKRSGRNQAAPASTDIHPSAAQKRWLARGAAQPGGKLPLFDEQGKEVPKATIRACIEAGWAEPWFANPAKPDWLVCKLTAEGRRAIGKPTAPG